MVHLRVPSEHQGDLQVTKVPQKLFAPGRRTLGSWRKISRLSCAGEAETHGQHRDLFRIVEHFTCHTHPFAQTISAGVIERQPRVMNLSARRLTHNQNPGLRIQLKDRPRAERQVSLTDGAGPNVG